MFNFDSGLLIFRVLYSIFFANLKLFHVTDKVLEAIISTVIFDGAFRAPF